MEHKNTGKTPFSEKRKKISEKLTKEDKKALSGFLKRFDTLTEAAEAIPMNRVTLYGISKIGSGSPYNINKIREALNVTA